MLRQGPPNASSAKRPRPDSQEDDSASDDPFRPTLQRKIVDICEHGNDGEGFIKVEVFMRWPNQLSRIQAKAVENGQTVKFDIAFLGPCPDYFKSIGLAFDFHDVLYLSLKGACIEQKSTAPNGFLPITLKYPDGIRFMFFARKNPLAAKPVVDYWAFKSAQEEASARKKPKLGPSAGDASFGDDWFATPATVAPSEVSTQNEPTTTVAESNKKPSTPIATANAAIITATTEDSTTSENAAQDEPLVKQPVLPSPPKSVTPPIQQALPKKLYRELPGRQRSGGSTSSEKPGAKAETVAPKPTKAKDAPAPAQHVDPEAPKGASKHASKKAQKKAAREAKKAAKPVQPLETPGEQTPEELVPVSIPHVSTDQTTIPSIPKVQVVEQPKTRPTSPHIAQTRTPPILESVAGPSTSHRKTPIPTAGPSRLASNAAVPSSGPSTSSRKTPASLAGPSRHTNNPAVPPSTPKSVNIPRAPRTPLATNRSSSTAGLGSQIPGLDMEAGCVGQQGRGYPPLNDIKLGYDHWVIGVMGLVGNDTKTQTGEWCRKVILVDPSNVEPDALHRGFVINCFAKYASGLPQGKCGDVLVLRGVQVGNYQGKPSGTCASYAIWSWFVFVPETGKILRETAPSVAGPGTPSSSQQSSARDDLGSAELRYCLALGDWWRAVQQEQERVLRESNVVRHQIGGGDAWGTGGGGAGQGGGRTSLAREHRLIQDAGPNVQPNGYFDCTVEVLFGHENNNNGGVYSIYVTDYTKNSSLTPVHASWCQPALAPYVMRIEMWNSAMQVGKDMRPQEFFALDNVRMRVSSGGHWEGKFVEGRKARKLDEDELEGEPHLAALLERKRKWEAEAEEIGAQKFPHQLVAEAQLDSHFCCTIEILRVSKKDDERSLLWGTDYTSRTDLAPVAATAEWTRVISVDRILKIALKDEQAKVADDLKPGDIIAVRNLRLKALSSDRQSVTGMLGGFERLIYKLNPETTGDEGCLALLSRKKAYEKRAKEQTAPAANSKKAAAAASKKKQPRKKTVEDVPDDAWSIKGIQDSRDHSKHAKYKVVARVVDYEPDSIDDFVILRCTNCEDDLPEQHRICTRCDTDMSETYAQPFYKFWLEIEDEEGTHLRLVAAHPSLRRRQDNVQALPDFIQDLPPVDFRSEEDDRALEKFKDRLRMFLGDELVDKHAELVHGQEEEGVQPSDSPLLSLVIGVTPGDDPTYFLWKCALLE